MSPTRPIAPTNDAWLGAGSWKSHAFALAVLFALPLILFSETTVGGMELNRHDIVQWRAGAESVLAHAEQYGERPLWVTGMFGGMPSYIAIKPQTIPHLDTLQSVFKAIYPAWPFWVLLGGMYLFLSLVGLRSPSAAFGSVLFGLTTYITIIIYAGHNSKFLALIYAPWVLAGYWLLMRRGQTAYGAALFTAALTLELRAGHPQITYYLLYLMLILWGHDTWQGLRGGRARPWGIATGLLALGTVLSVMAYAQGFLPIQEYSAYSTRGGSAIFGGDGLGQDYSFAWSQGILETLTLLVPDLFGGASPGYWGGKSVTGGPHYLGAVALPFVLLALVGSRRREVWLFLAAGALGVVFAWGENFMVVNGPAFNLVPLFDKFRAPETWLILTVLCLSVVAAIGMDGVLERFGGSGGAGTGTDGAGAGGAEGTMGAAGGGRKAGAAGRSRKATKQAKNVGAWSGVKPLAMPLGASMAIALTVFAMVRGFTYEKPGEVERIATQIAQQNQLSTVPAEARQAARNYVRTQLLPEREEKAQGDAARLLVLVALTGGVLALVAVGKVPAAPAMALLVGVAAADLITVNHRYVPQEAFVKGGMNEEAIILSQEREMDRFIADGVREPGKAYPYRVLPLLDGPFSNAIPSYFYPSLGGYSGAKLSLAQDVLLESRGPLFAGPEGINTGLLSLLNVKYLTYSDGLALTGWSVAQRTPEGTVYENLDVLPKAFFVDTVVVADSPRQAFESLFPGAVDLTRTAVVELGAGVAPPMATPDPAATVEVTEYLADRIRLRTERRTPGFLVLSEVYYPAGWSATVDGEPTAILKTDYLLRGLQVPAGTREIELRFEPESFRIGTLLGWISTGAQLLMVGFSLVVFVRRRKES